MYRWNVCRHTNSLLAPARDNILLFALLGAATASIPLANHSFDANTPCCYLVQVVRVYLFAVKCLPATPTLEAEGCFDIKLQLFQIIFLQF